MIGVGLISSSENLVSWKNISLKEEIYCTAAPIEHRMTVRLSERGYFHLCPNSFLIASASKLSRHSIDWNAAGSLATRSPLLKGYQMLGMA
jgi:hypothetical protein